MRYNNPTKTLSEKLFKASEEGSIDKIKTLIANGAYVNYVSQSLGKLTPIFFAAQNGHVNAIKILERLGAGVNKAGIDGRTPLFIAAKNGHTKAIKTLVRLGADVNKATENGFTPISDAAISDKVEAIETLVKLGADVNQANGSQKTTFLHIAVRAASIGTIKTLFFLGANVFKLETSNDQDDNFSRLTETLKSITSEELAEITQQPEKIKKIQESGFYAVLKIFNLQCDSTNEAEKQSFEQEKKDFLKRIFCEQGDITDDDQPKELQLDFLKFPPILKILETEKFSAENKLKIIKAIAEESNIFKLSLDDIRKVKASAKNPQFKSSFGPISEDERKLIFLTILRRLNFADINHGNLLNSLLDIILESISPKTSSPQIQPNQVLQESREVDKGINLVDLNQEKINSLSQELREASKNGNVDAIEALVTLGANVNQANNYGETPLYIATENGHVEAIEALARLGADVDKADISDETPLYVAAVNGHVKAIEALTRLGADVNKADNLGFTPVSLAISNIRFDAFRIVKVEAFKTLFFLGANVFKFETGYNWSNHSYRLTEALKSITYEELAEITQQPEKIKKIQESGFYAVLKIFNLQCDSTNEKEKQSFEQEKKDFLKRIFCKQGNSGNARTDTDQPKELQLDFLKFPPILKILETEEFSAENKLKIIKTIAEDQEEFQEFINSINKSKEYSDITQGDETSPSLVIKLTLTNMLPSKIKSLDFFDSEDTTLVDIILESISPRTPSPRIQPNQVLQQSRECNQI